MRALTPLEAEGIRIADDVLSYEDGDPNEDLYDAALAAAVERGCVRQWDTPEADPDSEYESTTHSEVTDLGRLALRVALPRPEVP